MPILEAVDPVGCLGERAPDEAVVIAMTSV